MLTCEHLTEEVRSGSKAVASSCSISGVNSIFLSGIRSVSVSALTSMDFVWKMRPQLVLQKMVESSQVNSWTRSPTQISPIWLQLKSWNFYQDSTMNKKQGNFIYFYSIMIINCAKKGFTLMNFFKKQVHSIENFFTLFFSA